MDLDAEPGAKDGRRRLAFLAGGLGVLLTLLIALPGAVDDSLSLLDRLNAGPPSAIVTTSSSSAGALPPEKLLTTSPTGSLPATPTPPTLSSLPSPSQPTTPPDVPIAPDPRLPTAAELQDCIKLTKGESEYNYYINDIPQDRWGDPVRGTVSSPYRDYTLWVFDADCTAQPLVTVPAGQERSFQAIHGQVWLYGISSAQRPRAPCDCGVFNLGNNGVSWRFDHEAYLMFFTD